MMDRSGGGEHLSRRIPTILRVIAFLCVTVLSELIDRGITLRVATYQASPTHNFDSMRRNTPLI
jgi:hypothetical protein